MVEAVPNVDLLIRQTEEAFQVLDKFLTREYFEAMDFVPALVERETPIAAYLRGVFNDPTEAAIRIARFWKYRKVFFGERWLLPMTMTGFGALNHFDCALIQCGAVLVRPRPRTGPLLIVDYTKAVDVFATALSLGIDMVGLSERIGLYFTVVFMEELSHGPSTLFHFVTSKTRPALEVNKRFWDFFKTASPASLGEVVVTQACEEGKQELFDFLRYQTVSVLGLSTSMVPKQIYANSPDTTIELLEMNGIDSTMVPTEIGGNLDCDTAFAQWQEMRVCIESFLAPPPQSLLPATQPALVPCNVMMTFGKATMGRSSKKFKTLLKRKRETGQSEAEFKRERNKLYIRRCKQKQKLEKLSLEDQKRGLEAQKNLLLQRNEELERALEAAQQAVRIYEHTSIDPTCLDSNGVDPTCIDPNYTDPICSDPTFPQSSEFILPPLHFLFPRDSIQVT